MKNILKNVVNGAVLVSLVAAVSGCATNRINLADENSIAVVNQDGEIVKVLWADVYHQDGRTWVSGVLKQNGLSRSSVKRHVDIQVLSVDGSVRYETFSDDVDVPRRRIGRGPGWGRFKTNLDIDVLPGSTVTVRIHSGAHDRLNSRVSDV